MRNRILIYVLVSLFLSSYASAWIISAGSYWNFDQNYDNSNTTDTLPQANFTIANSSTTNISDSFDGNATYFDGTTPQKVGINTTMNESFINSTGTIDFWVRRNNTNINNSFYLFLMGDRGSNRDVEHSLNIVSADVDGLDPFGRLKIRFSRNNPTEVYFTMYSIS